MSGCPTAAWVERLLRSDTHRMALLEAVRALDLPDAWIAAGFVRNAAWDALQGIRTPLSDIDVVYFDADRCEPSRDRALESRLRDRLPGLPWSVKNQARMHRRNGHRPYRDTLDAMSYWPEQQTAVAVRLVDTGQLECLSACGFACLRSGRVDANPNGSAAVFAERAARKRWSDRWPMLTVVLPAVD